MRDLIIEEQHNMPWNYAFDSGISLTKCQNSVRFFNYMEKITHGGGRTNLASHHLPCFKAGSTREDFATVPHKKLYLFLNIELLIPDILWLHSSSQKEDFHFMVIKQWSRAESKCIPHCFRFAGVYYYSNYHIIFFNFSLIWDFVITYCLNVIAIFLFFPFFRLQVFLLCRVEQSPSRI